ncbi:MAG: hypothetical protein Kow0098_17010 [Ignavibacteriaceae bacterium]
MNKAREKIRFRSIKQNDLTQIIRIHRDTFDKSHFSVYFSDKLLLDYFSTLLRFNPLSFLAEDETGNIVGFVISGNKTRHALKIFAKRNKFRLVLMLFKRPRFLIEKAEELFNKFFSDGKKLQPEMRIFIIAVSSAFKSQGIGSLLLKHFEKILLSQNLNVYGLSVRKGNYSAINFYKKNNFKLEFTDRKSYYFIKNIN